MAEFSGFFRPWGQNALVPLVFEALVGRGLEGAWVHRPARLALRFGPIHRYVGPPEEVAGVGAVGRCNRNSDARGDGDFSTGDGEGVAEHGGDAFGDFDRGRD